MSGDDLHLPPEICSQILTKLPVKSILRCRSVCKTWYSLISSPNFVSDHSVQTLNRTRVLVNRCERTTGLCKLSSHDESFVESHEHDDISEETLNHPGFSIVGSCDGLVCISKDDIDTGIDSFLIWNPSIRKLVELPFRLSSSGIPRYLLGFGFDSNSSDYKVLRVMYHYSDYLAPVVSEIVDLRNGVWRRLSPPMTRSSPFQAHLFQSCGVYLNGTFHWMADGFSSDCFLLSFNLSSEVFLEMGMPGGLEFKDSEYHTNVLAINGLLSVSLLSRQLQGVGFHYDWCSAWSLKEYGVTESWTKLFRIKLPYSRPMPSLLGFLERGEILILDIEENDGDDLVFYNRKRKESKVRLPTTNELIFNVSFYTETLALL